MSALSRWLAELCVNIAFLYWMIKALLMTVGIKLNFLKILESFKKKEKKE